MPQTARDFCTAALKAAGVTGLGQTALPEDINTAFSLLNKMLSRWQKDRWLVPYLYEVVAIGNNQKINLIGPGQYFNAKRPDKIQAAYFVQLTGNDPQNPVSFNLNPIFSYEDYATIALKEMNSWPLRFFYQNNYPYGNVYIWPIPSPQYEIHLVIKGPIGFTIQIQDGQITDGGAGYVDGAYLAVPLINVTGFGSGATADITVNAGEVTVANINSPSGDGYVINDILSVNNSDLGGTGAGFLYKVTNVTDSLDADFNMPEEYEEAIHYNLVRRICADYQYDLPPDILKLAKVALQTIRKANAQIPEARIPSQYRSVRNGNNFYIFNADAR